MNAETINAQEAVLLESTTLSSRQKNEMNAIKTKYGKTMENSDYLEKLEFFVIDVIKLKQIDKLIKLNRTEDHVPKWVLTGFIRMPGFLRAVCQLPRGYTYMNCINLFIESCEALILIGDDVGGTRLTTVDFNTQSDDHWTAFIELLVTLHRNGNRAGFKAKLINADKQIKYREQEYTSFVQALFNAHSRIVVLRIDLEYQKAIARTVSLSEALDDLDHLVTNMRNNAMFDHMVGYIFKVEYGVDRGIHIHSVLFFNGSLRNGANHIGHAKQIGEYWQNKITLGRGTYWNVNANIELYRQKGICGIGLIYWHECDLQANLLDMVIHYVCKEQQMIRSDAEPYRKIIRKQHSPKINEFRRGRPRAIMIDSASDQLEVELT
jgi:hypothetical protein